MSPLLLPAKRIEKQWGRHRLSPWFDDQPAHADPVGEIWFDAPGGLAAELLVKYLFTNEKLSVQVHPDDAAAQARGLPRGKDECWLVLAAEPGASIAIGTRQPMTADALRSAAIDGSIELLLDWKPVTAGDFFFAPSGTVHAIGSGLTVIEIQQNSDTTYRLYDYGRPRELHLDDGVAVARAVPYAPPSRPRSVSPGRVILCEGPTFVVERLSGGEWPWSPAADRPAWLVAIAGAGEVDGVGFGPGKCLFLPQSARIRIDPDGDVLLAYPGNRRADPD